MGLQTVEVVMPKTNFSKVEEALNEGIRKMTVSNLLRLADISAKTGRSVYNPGKLVEDSETESPVSEPRKQMIAGLLRDMKYMQKNDPKMYSKLGLKKHTLNKMIDNQATLTEEEWETLRQARIRIDEFRRNFNQNAPKIPDDKLVEEERVKHINKRFNVSEKWLPLT